MSNQEVEVIEDAEVIEDGDLFDGAVTVESEPEPEMSPEELKQRLDRLGELEAVVDNGLGKFYDVGMALVEIRDTEYYKAKGYKTFALYLKARWSMSLSRGYQMIDAAQMSDVVSTNVESSTRPTHESQLRPIVNAFRDDPDKAQAIWAKAVEVGEGRPTQAVVAELVEEARDAPIVGIGETPHVKHPAPFSTAILKVIRELLEDRKKVLDPFAGTGRIHLLTEYGFDTYGVEIEKEWADLNERTVVGSALKLPGKLRKGSMDAIATSPTYGNRLADSYDATDPELRHSYHFDLGRVPSDGSSAVMPWGDEYRAFHQKAWTEAARVLKANGRFILNIKDHIRDGEWQDVSAWHAATIIGLGFRLVAIRPVGTRGRPSGENADVRSDAELVLAFDRIEDNG